MYAESLIPTVKRALTDPLPEVRQAAANTFDSLHGNIGPRALDEILPDLLSHLVCNGFLACNDFCRGYMLYADSGASDKPAHAQIYECMKFYLIAGHMCKPGLVSSYTSYIEEAL